MSFFVSSLYFMSLVVLEVHVVTCYDHLMFVPVLETVQRELIMNVVKEIA